MKVIFDTGRLEHIKDKSSYNHNYYKLPYSIDGCSVLYEEWEDDSFEGYYHLGGFDESGEYISKHRFYGDIDGRVDLLNNKEPLD